MESETLVKITMPKCKICHHESRDEIDRLILEGVSGVEIVKRFPDLNDANVSGHKNKHVLANPAERLNELFNTGLMNPNLKIKDIDDLYKTQQILEKLKGRDCESCQFRKEAGYRMTLGEAIRDFLEREDEGIILDRQKELITQEGALKEEKDVKDTKTC